MTAIPQKPLQEGERFLDGGKEIACVGVLDELGDDLGIGIRRENEALFLQHGA